MPAISADRFEQGMTYDQYKAQMTRNRERLEANERQLELTPDDLEVFSRLPRPLRVLALAEDWCGDVIANLPILGRIAAETGKLDVRIFLRDQNLDIMDQYLNEGKYRSIPVFVFFDENNSEIGRFVERPKSVSTEQTRRRQEIYDRNPDFGQLGQPVDQLAEDVRVRLQQELAAMRSALAPFANSEVVRELRAIVERAA